MTAVLVLASLWTTFSNPPASAKHSPSRSTATPKLSPVQSKPAIKFSIILSSPQQFRARNFSNRVRQDLRHSSSPRSPTATAD